MVFSDWDSIFLGIFLGISALCGWYLWQEKKKANIASEAKQALEVNK